MKRIAILTLCAVLLPVSVLAMDFQSWVNDFKQDARQQGISQNLLDQAFTGVAPIPRIIELDRKQPEGRLTFAQYKKNVITKDRINKGRALYQQHRTLLNKIAAEYDVPAAYIVALWGIETSFGANTGGFYVVPALATLAYDGRRSEFFRKELIGALKIVDAGHISLANMKGSWAGAMGQNQFMPSSFERFAVDANGDGHKDIWNTLPDVFASTANYLHKSGWKGDQRWGREIDVPAGMSESDLKSEEFRPLSYWSQKGVTLLDGASLPSIDGMRGRIVLPDGVGGPAFMVYDNYKVIMTWNKSTYFATSVGLLADAIAQ